ncbi:hypothetical protein [Saccharolobus caldissimus]|uniref:Uncharacterized protein n=1 Tax=Saccharolobus caldissimus TaxID=1702097 RepID=A0AAQ4CUR5_9CREN|nr:hypothetical protein [Saccharolobus caldissimus]BDB99546.1 hypothetical protein SACC_25630 [Saccharolobus caldissimus]
METYQILGLIGSLLLLVALFIPFMFYGYGYGMMGRVGMMGGMMGGPFFFFPFIAIPALILGLVGSLISDRQIGGILLIIAAVLSLPVFFGFFGISFVLLLIGGLLALFKK